MPLGKKKAKNYIVHTKEIKELGMMYLHIAKPSRYLIYLKNNYTTIPTEGINLSGRAVIIVQHFHIIAFSHN